MDFSWIYSFEAWTALLALVALEIVLGIDNIIFISIIVNKLPKSQQARGRFIGLALALILRVLLLLCITWVMGLTNDLFKIKIPKLKESIELGISGKDLILIIGGIFLIFKSTREIHHKIEVKDGNNDENQSKKIVATFGSVLIQIALLDLIFSLDSVITAVGMVEHIEIMVIAVTVAIIVMMIFAGVISNFINRHPTLQMLALSFLILIGVALVAEGMEFHIHKGYIYFAMSFSLIVEIFNMKIRSKKLLAQRIAEK